MANDYFSFKEFTIWQHGCAMKVCTDSCILGAFAANKAALHKAATALDIGGGTGLLSLMIAQKSHAAITAVEIDETAYTRMKENFAASSFKSRLTAVHTDVKLLEKGPFDFIVSNPPFFESDLRAPEKETNLARHDSGLLLSDLAEQMQRLLHPQGYCCIMVPWLRRDYMLTQLQARAFHVHEELQVRHSASHDPFRSVLLASPAISPAKFLTHELPIRADNGYSTGFAELLGPYYLNKIFVSTT